ncbi:allantoicase Alc [Histoplasma capsulatum H143]|uniref:Allantoicase Alc n=1 Tax=Ajellomyces capsulatus (strain H143) TaxID=544712 RepID=C6HCC3_AJECH|nr:allantoicase Alc [Histoplasma capsulatum H143]
MQEHLRSVQLFVVCCRLRLGIGPRDREDSGLLNSLDSAASVNRESLPLFGNVSIYNDISADHKPWPQPTSPDFASNSAATSAVQSRVLGPIQRNMQCSVQCCMVWASNNPSNTDGKITPLPTAADIDAVFSSTTTNLASSSLNATVLACSDEFFAAASNLLTPTPPIHRPGVFVHTGAWYDGWETRRHNQQEYDWVVIKLGVGSGIVVGVEIDTAYFVGNYGEGVVVEGAYVDQENALVSDIVKPAFNGWTTILPRQPCGPSRRQGWLLPRPSDPITHVRLRMYPDGGSRGCDYMAMPVSGFLKKDVKDGRDPKADDEGWVEVVRGDQPCKADLEHVFEGELLGNEVGGKVFSHVMLTMVPDGGVKRFRVFGRRAT